MDYRREIDGLRAVAVVPVIFFHAGLNAFSGGFVGVDVFFVISGYLLTTITLGELERNQFSLARFYERRARRILPALFLIMLVSLILAWFTLLPPDMKDFSQSLLAVTLFASNVLFWFESGYFDTAAELKPLLHTWSLAVEEQYYILFPVFLLLFWNQGKRRLLLVLGMIFVASLVSAQWASITAPSAAFYLLPTRIWELFLGVFTAFYLSQKNRKPFSKGINEASGALGLGLIVFAIFAYDKSTPFPSVYTLVPTLGTVLIIIFTSQQTTIGRFLSNKLFVSIGLVSYSAYLWHQPLFVFARYQNNSGSSYAVEPPVALIIILTFILAYLSWRFVEMPSRNIDIIKRKKFFAFAFIYMCFFLAIGYHGQSTNGFENRYRRVLYGDIGHIDFHQYIQDTYFDCEPNSIAQTSLRWKGFLRCKQSKQGIPEIILLGDSHAEHFFIGLAENLPNKNVAFYIRRGMPSPDSQKFKAIFDELLSNTEKQHILLTMNFLGRAGARGEVLRNGFSSTIKALLSAGKTVTLLSDVPAFNSDPRVCTYAISQVLGSACQISITEIEQQRANYELTLKKLSKDFGLQYIRTDTPLCSAENCKMSSGHWLLYRDRHHLNIMGSKIVGKHLADSLSL